MKETKEAIDVALEAIEKNSPDQIFQSQIKVRPISKVTDVLEIYRTILSEKEAKFREVVPLMQTLAMTLRANDLRLKIQQIALSCISDTEKSYKSQKEELLDKQVISVSKTVEWFEKRKNRFLFQVTDLEAWSDTRRNVNQVFEKIQQEKMKALLAATTEDGDWCVLGGKQEESKSTSK